MPAWRINQPNVVVSDNQVDHPSRLQGPTKDIENGGEFDLNCRQKVRFYAS